MSKTLATTKDYAIFILAVFTGILAWMLSPVFTGHQTPLAADWLYYIVSLFMAGAIFGAICTVRVHRWAIALFIGQLIYILMSIIIVALGPLYILLVPLLVVYSYAAYVGATSSSTLIIKYKVRQL